MSFTKDKKEMGRNIFLSRIGAKTLSPLGFFMQNICIPKKMLKDFINKNTSFIKADKHHTNTYFIIVSYDDYLKIRGSKYYRNPIYY